MRKSVPLEVPAHLVESARLYAPTRHELDAVCYVLERYPVLVAELRAARRRLDTADQELAAFDDRLQILQSACRSILDL